MTAANTILRHPELLNLPARALEKKEKKSREIHSFFFLMRYQFLSASISLIYCFSVYENFLSFYSTYLSQILAFTTYTCITYKN